MLDCTPIKHFVVSKPHDSALEDVIVELNSAMTLPVSEALASVAIKLPAIIGDDPQSDN
jgi:hypothetical protein